MMTQNYDLFLLIVAPMTSYLLARAIIRYWYSERRNFVDYLAEKQKGKTNGEG